MAEKARQMRESLPKEEKATNSADRPFKWFKENEEALRKFFEPLDAVRKGKQNALAKKRKELNPWVKVANGVRARTSNAVRIFSMRGAIRKPYKRGEFRKITGCSEEDFRKHIMSFWPKDGSWGLHNFGKKEGWQVDHIVPISYFKDVWGSGDWELIFQYDKIVNHYTNLHPKSTAENIRKGDSRPEWVELEFGKLWSSFHEEIYGAGSKRRVLGIA